MTHTQPPDAAHPRLTTANDRDIVIVASYRAYVWRVLLSSIVVWCFGVYTNRTHRQALIVLAIASLCSAPVGPFFGYLRRVPLIPRPAPHYQYRNATHQRLLASTLWPAVIALAGISLAQSAHPDVLALIEGSFLGPTITMARELRRIDSMERRHNGRVFIELASRSGRSGIRRSKSRLWVLPGPLGGTS